MEQLVHALRRRQFLSANILVVCQPHYGLQEFVAALHNHRSCRYTHHRKDTTGRLLAAASKHTYQRAVRVAFHTKRSVLHTHVACNEHGVNGLESSRSS